MKVVRFFLILCFILPNCFSTITEYGDILFRNVYKPGKINLRNKTSGRIIGGKEAPAHSIPYQVFLILSDSMGKSWFCGGSLISENYVLTAGHCGDQAFRAEVHLGAHRPLSDPNHKILISSNIKIHEGYNKQLIKNDIGLIKLPEPVALKDQINAVQLPKSTSSSYVGATARISGWGLTDGFGTKISDVLNYVDVKVISNAECLRFFGDTSTRDSIICTSGDDLTGSCNGDSGGPLVVDDVLVGVVSFGVTSCLPGYPSAFTRVTSYLDWIHQNMK